MEGLWGVFDRIEAVRWIQEDRGIAAVRLALEV